MTSGSDKGKEVQYRNCNAIKIVVDVYRLENSPKNTKPLQFSRTAKILGSW